MKCLECDKKEARKDDFFCSDECKEWHRKKVQNDFDFNRMMIAKGLRDGLL